MADNKEILIVIQQQNEFIKDRMDKVETKLDTIQEQQARTREEVSALKARSALFGGIFGAIVSAIVAAIFKLFSSHN